MKLMFASDIHGSSYYCNKMLEAYKNEKAQRLILLGDLLYHGPRNDLPRKYDPKKVIEMLNSLKNDIYAVRGNCDAEVDQMVLEFSILSEYCVLFLENKAIYASHGHVFHQDHLPPMKEGDIFIHGHTHVLSAKKKAGCIILNPGSISLPKEGNVQTYGILEGNLFSIKDFQGNSVEQMIIENKREHS